MPKFFPQLEIRQAYKEFNDRAAPRQFYIVPLTYEIGTYWLIGRNPNASAFYEVIGVLNPALTANWAKITAIGTQKGVIHQLELIAPLDPKTQERKNPVYLKRSNIRIDQLHELRDNDTLVLAGLALEITYRVKIEDVRKEDDTLV